MSYIKLYFGHYLWFSSNKSGYWESWQTRIFVHTTEGWIVVLSLCIEIKLSTLLSEEKGKTIKKQINMFFIKPRCLFHSGQKHFFSALVSCLIYFDFPLVLSSQKFGKVANGFLFIKNQISRGHTKCKHLLRVKARLFGIRLKIFKVFVGSFLMTCSYRLVFVHAISIHWLEFPISQIE